MAAVTETQLNTAAAEQIRFRRPRNQTVLPIDPNPQVSPLLHSTRCKPTISSLFLSTFTNNGNGPNMGANESSPPPASSSSSSGLRHKKKNFSAAAATFRGLGCATSSQVSAPAAVIRSSADWQAKKARKKKQRNQQLKKKSHQQQQMATTATTGSSSSNPTPSPPFPPPPPPPPIVVVPDVWCAPGIGFVADASVDCVVSRRPMQGRGRIDSGERLSHRERSCIMRRGAHFEHMTVMDSPTEFEASRFGSDVFGGRHHRHFRHRSPGGLAEIMMFQGSLLSEGRSDVHDRFRDWRLDVDNMSYEELLELGERIGYVNTGLKEDEIFRCIRKTKHSILDTLASHFPSEIDWKCSICQEEYEAEDDVGKLECGHSYHISCIKQWLQRKNACPVCKVAAATQ